MIRTMKMQITLRVALPLLATLAVHVSAASAQAPQGNIEAGKTAWAQAPFCANCHGTQGEGGFGPDLAGRALTFDQFRRAVRQPWGIMPAYTETQLPDERIADLYAYLGSLPKPAEVGNRRLKAPPAGSPLGQVYLMETIGCANCHNVELRQVRKVIGGQSPDIDFDHFADLIYRHTDHYPKGRMGNYSTTRVPEAVLRDIYRYARDLGFLVPITATMTAGAADGPNTTYTLTLRNTGMPGKGLVAQDVTVALLVPAGTKVIGATGGGYEGVKSGIEGEGTARGEAAVWKVARIAPHDELKYSITIAGAPLQPAVLFKDSVVGWTKPRFRPGLPDLPLKDERMLKNHDYVTLTFLR